MTPRQTTTARAAAATAALPGSPFVLGATPGEHLGVAGTNFALASSVAGGVTLWLFDPAGETMVPHGMQIYGELCGWTLARAHARSGARTAIAAYLGGSDIFDQAITHSPPPTPIRTSVTTRPWPTPSPQDGSPPNPTCKIPAGQQ